MAMDGNCGVDGRREGGFRTASRCGATSTRGGGEGFEFLRRKSVDIAVMWQGVGGCFCLLHLRHVWFLVTVGVESCGSSGRDPLSVVGMVDTAGMAQLTDCADFEVQREGQSLMT